MTRDEAQVGMTVSFGRPNGEKTLAIIEKVNQAKAKVRTLEGRGQRGASGVIWAVPYEMMTPSSYRPLQPCVPVLAYNAFDEDSLILEAIAGIYNRLSPENLHCDGEISNAEAQRRRVVLERKLRGLFTAYGRTVSEQEISTWWTEKRIWEERQRQLEADGQ